MSSNRARSLLDALGGRTRQYKPVPDDESRAMLEEEEGGALPYEPFSPEITKQLAPLPTRKRSLTFKVWSAVFLTLVLWFVLVVISKLAAWAFHPDNVPAVKNVPIYSTSLGCAAATHMYNNSMMTVTVPFDKEDAKHAFDVFGDIVGTFSLAEGASDMDEVKYELTIRSDDPSLLDRISFRHAEIASNGKVENSQFVIVSPRLGGKSSNCLRYDIKMFVPPSLKTLHIAAHAVTHLQFDPLSKIQLDRFHATLYAMSNNNLIIPNQSLQAKTLGLEVYRGYITGDVSIVESTSISTQRGDGVASVRVHPLAPSDDHTPKKAVLWTVTGAGHSDFTWVTHGGQKRPIEADHKSSMNGDVYLDYRNAHFDGLIALDSRHFKTTNVHAVSDGKDDKWTHYAGDQTASDKLMVQSRGWTWLYF